MTPISGKYRVGVEHYDTVIVNATSTRKPMWSSSDSFVEWLDDCAVSESAPKEVMVATSRLRQNGVNLRAVY